MEFFILIMCILFITLLQTKKLLNKHLDYKKINEWSYQRYADFYGDTVLKDELFLSKINKIYDLIVNKKVDDINLIAKESGCTYVECILKIRYLKNKRQLGDLYIDRINGIVKKCSAEDQALLNKYSHFIYVEHLQIDEIASLLPQTSIANFEETKNIVLNDLKYLDDKGLINGIILNEVDQKIIYYSVEKHKKEKDYVTINCPNCGALNDINRGSKVRCKYCDTIVVAPLRIDKDK